MPTAPHKIITRESAEAMDLLIGRVLAGKYRIEERVGEGSMGAVYRATHVTLERTLAVKVLLPSFSLDPTFHTRFLREARAASRLDHPHSVAVLDFGTEPEDGTAYLVMEYLNGRSLFDALCDEDRLDIPRALRVITQVLAALAIAHDAGVIHRDLKPENIMLVPRLAEDGASTEEHAKVADFGIASVADARGSLSTLSGLITGTPEYMSPEQGRGGPLDGRSDLYACGVLLYQLVTGTLPFEDSSALGVMLKHMNEAPEPPSRRYAAVPAALEAVILRALEKDPERRFSDARVMRSALLDLLDAYESSLGIAPRRTSTSTLLPPVLAAPAKSGAEITLEQPALVEEEPVSPTQRTQPKLSPMFIHSSSPLLTRRRPTTHAPRVVPVPVNHVPGLQAPPARTAIGLLAGVALLVGASPAALLREPPSPARPSEHAAVTAHVAPAVGQSATRPTRPVPELPSAPVPQAHTAPALVAAAPAPAESPAAKPPTAAEPAHHASRAPTKIAARAARPRAAQIAASVFRPAVLSSMFASAEGRAPASRVR